MAHNYILQVTAGPSYDQSTHKVVPVNTATPLSITSPYMSIDLNVRVQVRVAVSFSETYFSLAAMHNLNDIFNS
jgi:hypothetical protein